MIGGKVPVSMAALAMLGLSMPAVAADGSASGIASNRMALAMPLAPEGASDPCPPNADGSIGHCGAANGSNGSSVRFLLAGVAAAGAVAGVAIGASSGHHHGGGGSPVSP